MATVPAKITERIANGIKRFQPILESAKSRDVGESDTVIIIIDMLTEIFGYDKFSEVTSEYSIKCTTPKTRKGKHRKIRRKPLPSRAATQGMESQERQDRSGRRFACDGRATNSPVQQTAKKEGRQRVEIECRFTTCMEKGMVDVWIVDGGGGVRGRTVKSRADTIKPREFEENGREKVAQRLGVEQILRRAGTRRWLVGFGRCNGWTRPQLLNLLTFEPPRQRVSPARGLLRSPSDFAGNRGFSPGSLLRSPRKTAEFCRCCWQPPASLVASPGRCDATTYV